MRLTPLMAAVLVGLAGVLVAAMLSEPESGAFRSRSARSAPAEDSSDGPERQDVDLAVSTQDSQQSQPELFRPEDLVLLEGPDRAVWQQPDLVMDDLGITPGARVADVGAGAGWFTIRLAQRVGPGGTVIAQDLQHQMVTAIARRVEREELKNVRVVQGQDNSPNLPRGVLDAVLVVDVYPEIDSEARVPWLRSLTEALVPDGRIGIVNYKPGGGGPGPAPDRRVPSARVEQDADAAGLQVLLQRDLRYQYLLVLERQ